MYLARRRTGNRTRYVISESYPAGSPGEACWHSRDLLNLGADPGAHLHYPGGRAFYIDPAVEENLSAQGVEIDADELENLFWPFVAPEVRYRLRGLRQRGARGISKPALTARESATVRDALHPFDKRRYYFLRCGRRDRGQLQRVPPKFFRDLLHKSRDELEQRFRVMEAGLSLREVKGYVYAGFHLEARLLTQQARTRGAAPGMESVDAHFLRKLCELNDDPALWGKTASRGSLRQDLARYVWMYFDHDLPRPNIRAEYIREFINRHRRHRPPAKIEKALAETKALFGLELKALKKLKRRELSRLYRRRARDLHPDTGGNPDQFIRLTVIYRHLVKTQFGK